MRTKCLPVYSGSDRNTLVAVNLMSNMKPLKIALLWLLAMVGTTVLAQTYLIDWFTIDGGGGTSTGGVYSVSGTIGQPDAGATMSGGNYSLSGGCWSLFAIQSPGSPLLTITLTTTNTALVSWPFPSTGFA